MKQNESNAYVLGTEDAELKRLGFQHQVWSEEARIGWRNAGFKYGDTLLDLGSGPGFTTFELGSLVGPDGKVIAVDKSENYTNFLESANALYKLPIQTICTDFNDLELAEESLDGAYHRWAMAWINQPEHVISKLYKALRSGGKVVSHEYFDWSTLQLEPSDQRWEIAKQATLRSFKEVMGNIDVGRFLVDNYVAQGFKVLSIRPMVKIMRPSDVNWNWPQTFFEIYFPKVASMGFMTLSEAKEAISAIKDIKMNPNAIMLTPTMIEIISEKP